MNSDDGIKTNRRILIVDDNESIHADFRKILAGEAGAAAIDEDEAALFGDTVGARCFDRFEIDSAHQGDEAVEMVHGALRKERLFSVAFVDVRMPPGMDGVETVAKLWQLDPFLQIVICTAYSDYSWHEMVEKLGSSDRLLILKKPFDNVEVRQLAETLSEKWRLSVKQWVDVQTIRNLCRDRSDELYKAKTDLASVRATMEETARFNCESLPKACDELRAKLRTVASRAENLLDATTSDSERRLTTDAIIQDATQGLGIIDCMLDFSRSQNCATVAGNP